MGPSDENEKTYVFKASGDNYVDGSEEQAMCKDNLRSSRRILHEISKLSQMNISKCNYSVLTAGCTDSTECLLKQHASPVEVDGLGTPTRGTKHFMVNLDENYIICLQEPW